MAPLQLAHETLLRRHQLRGSVLPILTMAYNASRQHLLTADEQALRLFSTRKELSVLWLDPESPSPMILLHHAIHDVYIVVYDDQPADHPDACAVQILHASLAPLLRWRPHDGAVAARCSTPAALAASAAPSSPGGGSRRGEAEPPKDDLALIVSPVASLNEHQPRGAISTLHVSSGDGGLLIGAIDGTVWVWRLFPSPSDSTALTVASRPGSPEISPPPGGPESDDDDSSSDEESSDEESELDDDDDDKQKDKEDKSQSGAGSGDSGDDDDDDDGVSLPDESGGVFEIRAVRSLGDDGGPMELFTCGGSARRVRHWLVGGDDDDDDDDEAEAEAVAGVRRRGVAGDVGSAGSRSDRLKVRELSAHGVAEEFEPAEGTYVVGQATIKATPMRLELLELGMGAESIARRLLLAATSGGLVTLYEILAPGGASRRARGIRRGRLPPEPAPNPLPVATVAASTLKSGDRRPPAKRIARGARRSWASGATRRRRRVALGWMPASASVVVGRSDGVLEVVAPDWKAALLELGCRAADAARAKRRGARAQRVHGRRARPAAASAPRTGPGRGPGRRRRARDVPLRAAAAETLVCVGDAEGGLRLWTLRPPHRGAKCLWSTDAHTGAVVALAAGALSAVAAHPAEKTALKPLGRRLGALVASAAADGVVKLWRLVHGGRGLVTVGYFIVGGAVTALAVATPPPGDLVDEHRGGAALVVAGFSSGLVEAWPLDARDAAGEAEPSREVERSVHRSGHLHEVTALDAFPGQGVLLSASLDRSVALWRAPADDAGLELLKCVALGHPIYSAVLVRRRGALDAIVADGAHVSRVAQRRRGARGPSLLNERSHRVSRVSLAQSSTISGTAASTPQLAADPRPPPAGSRASRAPRARRVRRRPLASLSFATVSLQAPSAAQAFASAAALGDLVSSGAAAPVGDRAELVPGREPARADAAAAAAAARSDAVGVVLARVAGPLRVRRPQPRPVALAHGARVERSRRESVVTPGSAPPRRDSLSQGVWNLAFDRQPTTADESPGPGEYLRGGPDTIQDISAKLLEQTAAFAPALPASRERRENLPAMGSRPATADGASRRGGQGRASDDAQLAAEALITQSGPAPPAPELEALPTSTQLAAYPDLACLKTSIFREADEEAAASMGDEEDDDDFDVVSIDELRNLREIRLERRKNYKRRGAKVTFDELCLVAEKLCGVVGAAPPREGGLNVSRTLSRGGGGWVRREPSRDGPAKAYRLMSRERKRLVYGDVGEPALVRVDLAASVAPLEGPNCAEARRARLLTSRDNYRMETPPPMGDARARHARSRRTAGRRGSRDDARRATASRRATNPSGSGFEQDGDAPQPPVMNGRTAVREARRIAEAHIVALLDALFAHGTEAPVLGALSRFIDVKPALVEMFEDGRASLGDNDSHQSAPRADWRALPINSARTYVDTLAWLRDRGCLFRDAPMDAGGGRGLRSTVGAEGSLFGGGAHFRTTATGRATVSGDALRHLSVSRRAAASCVRQLAPSPSVASTVVEALANVPGLDESPLGHWDEHVDAEAFAELLTTRVVAADERQGQAVEAGSRGDKDAAWPESLKELKRLLLRFVAADPARSGAISGAAFCRAMRVGLKAKGGNDGGWGPWTPPSELPRDESLLAENERGLQHLLVFYRDMYDQQVAYIDFWAMLWTEATLHRRLPLLEELYAIAIDQLIGIDDEVGAALRAFVMHVDRKELPKVEEKDKREDAPGPGRPVLEPVEVKPSLLALAFPGQLDMGDLDRVPDLHPGTLTIARPPDAARDRERDTLPRSFTAAGAQAAAQLMLDGLAHHAAEALTHAAASHATLALTYADAALPANKGGTILTRLAASGPGKPPRPQVTKQTRDQGRRARRGARSRGASPLLKTSLDVLRVQSMTGQYDSFGRVQPVRYLSLDEAEQLQRDIDAAQDEADAKRLAKTHSKAVAPKEKPKKVDKAAEQRRLLEEEAKRRQEEAMRRHEEELERRRQEEEAQAKAAEEAKKRAEEKAAMDEAAAKKKAEEEAARLKAEQERRLKDLEAAKQAEAREKAEAKRRQAEEERAAADAEKKRLKEVAAAEKEARKQAEREARKRQEGERQAMTSRTRRSREAEENRLMEEAEEEGEFLREEEREKARAAQEALEREKQEREREEFSGARSDRGAPDAGRGGRERQRLAVEAEEERKRKAKEEALRERLDAEGRMKEENERSTMITNTLKVRPTNAGLFRVAKQKRASIAFKDKLLGKVAQRRATVAAAKQAEEEAAKLEAEAAATGRWAT
ncbi:hypothetical protein JL722_12906 [Aureococcus anophagefferens]|nr:hypothetical protein JL722_12906 [Aureococcus anophagefferens]